jgi:hypothetical protein
MTNKIIDTVQFRPDVPESNENQAETLSTDLNMAALLEAFVIKATQTIAAINEVCAQINPQEIE